MSEYLTKEKVEEIFAAHAGDKMNTGSTEGQVALFTFRIQFLTEHLKKNKKDHATRRSLMTMVGKRKRLLNYLQRRDLAGYRALIEKLGLRK